MSMKIVTRAEWHAQSPKSVEYINHLVPYVIIHHSHTPAACFSREKCISTIQSIQRHHQTSNGWADIGYSFVINGDGLVYEGRGFNVVGAHAPNYNNRSIGICLIGNWDKELPPKEMLLTTQNLIRYAIDEGYLSEDYTLYGHRQVRSTTCPGEALFNEIKKWDNFKAIIGN